MSNIKYSKKTIDLYTNALINMKNKLNIKDFNNFTDVVDILKKITMSKTITYIKAILWFDKNFEKNISTGEHQKLNNDIRIKYSEKLSELSSINNKKYKENILTELQKTKYEKWENISRVLDNYLNNDIYDTNILILGLYILFPPRRLEDYAHMYYVCKNNFNEDETKNYCVITKTQKKFIFNKYKTFKKFGRQEFEIPDDLFELIKNVVNHNKIKHEDKLIENINSEDALRIRLQHIFLNNIGKKISIQILRHSFVEFIDKKISIDE